tara:strand:- start:1167 stop:1313 length:147 start_codon:yes stop_codon:yes gene_type:complete
MEVVGFIRSSQEYLTPPEALPPVYLGITCVNPQALALLIAVFFHLLST